MRLIEVLADGGRSPMLVPIAWIDERQRDQQRYLCVVRQLHHAIKLPIACSYESQ
jgi:hypothetical protein